MIINRSFYRSNSRFLGDSSPPPALPWFKQKPDTFVAGLRPEFFLPEYHRFHHPLRGRQSARGTSNLKQVQTDMLLTEKELEILIRDTFKLLMPHQQLNTQLNLAHEALMRTPTAKAYHLSWPNRLQHFVLKPLPLPEVLPELEKARPLFLLEYDSGKVDRAASRLQVPVYFEPDNAHPDKKMRMVVAGESDQLPWPASSIQIIPSEVMLEKLPKEGHQTMLIALSLPNKPYSFQDEDWKNWNRIPPEGIGRIIDLGVTRPESMMDTAVGLLHEIKHHLSKSLSK